VLSRGVCRDVLAHLPRLQLRRACRAQILCCSDEPARPQLSRVCQGCRSPPPPVMASFHGGRLVGGFYALVLRSAKSSVISEPSGCEEGVIGAHFAVSAAARRRGVVLKGKASTSTRM
jgi:hypothetical protein